jgi:hypothetical protein
MVAGAGGTGAPLCSVGARAEGRMFATIVQAALDEYGGGQPLEFDRVVRCTRPTGAL